MCDLFAFAVIPGSAVSPEATQHVEYEIINGAWPLLQKSDTLVNTEKHGRGRFSAVASRRATC